MSCIFHIYASTLVAVFTKYSRSFHTELDDKSPKQRGNCDKLWRRRKYSSSTARVRSGHPRGGRRRHVKSKLGHHVRWSTEPRSDILWAGEGATDVCEGGWRHTLLARSLVGVAESCFSVLALSRSPLVGVCQEKCH